MNNMLDHIIIKPALLGYIFGAREILITTDTNEIHINHKAVQLTISYDDLLTILEHKSGLFFDSIIIPTTEAQYTIGWLSSDNAKGVMWFSKNAFYEALSRPVLELANSTKTHLKKYYPRKKYWQEIEQECQYWQSKYQSLPPEEMLTGKQRKAFKYIDQIASRNNINLKIVRAAYTKQQLVQYEEYFDTVESNPLTYRQRLACVIDEENNLILAGAGSGKTSVMVGRAGYLLQSEQAKPEEILMLAFANKAAGEMSERISEKLAIATIKASTFHSLGQSIISTVENGKPSVSVLATDHYAFLKFIAVTFNELMEQEDYKETVVKYFLYHKFEPINPFGFQTTESYNQTVHDNDFRTAQGEKVKGYQELLIANFLYKSGIKYTYEAKYKIATRTIEFRQYQPDFYLTDFDIYIEHYGTDREGNTAPYIDAQKYNEGIKWKRDLHETNKTKCIETFHYEWMENTLLDNLEEKLLNYDISLNPLSGDEILATEENNSQISKLSELLAKMLKLYKASNLNDSLFFTENNTETSTSTLKIIFNKLLTVMPYKSDAVNNRARLKSAYELLMPLYEKYQSHLLENEDIDFDDMINKAIHYVKNGSFVSPWKYIMVDEFQDISSSRSALIAELKSTVEDCSLFCVGDDWQAIYRFAGSDLTYVTGFQKKFGITKTTKLDRTFRFNNSISEISSGFITRNPEQVDKNISTNTKVSLPAVSLLRAENGNDKDKLKNIHQILTAISLLKEESTVLLLGRYKINLPTRKQLSSIEEVLGNITVSAMTMHASKGKEADFVVVLGLKSGFMGFPSERKDHPFINALLPKLQKYPFAEERRLFYVAITRAKERTYLIADMKEPSHFVVELINDDYDIEMDEFEVSGSQLVYQQVHCISCKVGKLVPREGKYGKFYGCNCYPRCNHLEKGCKTCETLMKRNGSYKICTNEECNGWAALCPNCGGELVKREGQYGDFWGCKNYHYEGESCGYTAKTVNPPFQIEEEEIEECIF